MDIIDRKTLLRLGAERSGPCVSIYTPLEKAGPEVRRNPITLSNQISSAKESLIESGVRPETARRILEPLAGLADDGDPSGREGEGFAAFLSTEERYSYEVPFRLPEAAIVASRFVTRPLLPLLESERHFYVLALSRNKTRLMRATADGIREERVEDMPRDFMELAGMENPQKSLQHHMASPGQTQYHGQGIHKDSALDDLFVDYVRQIQDAVAAHLRPQDAPLLLATVDETSALYRRFNKYGRLMDEVLEGNPDDANIDRLRAEGWDIVRETAEGRRAEAVDRYLALAGIDERVARGVEEVLPAAYQGRVEELFVASDGEAPGTYDGKTDTLERLPVVGPGADDLLDLAAIHTLQHGGTLHVLSLDTMPEGPAKGPAVAVLRDWV